MDIIALKEYIQINSRFSFVLTNKAFESLYAIFRENYKKFLMALSKESRFLIERRTRDDGTYSYTVHFRGYCLNCTENRSQSSSMVIGLLITSIKPEDFNSQNSAMRSGENFYFSKGSCVTIRIKSCNLYEEYVNGNRYDNTTYSSMDYSPAIKQTKDYFDKLEKKVQKPDTKATEYQPSEKFEEYLELAENYSNIESMLAESKVRADGGLSYTKIEALDYERTDRMAYRFLVTEFKKDVYAAGNQIEFEDILGNVITAEILAHDKTEDGQIFLDALFNKQVNIKSFSSVGRISLSFSTVIKDVQQKAIDRLRENEAPAKYMDDIFGKNKPQGFNNTDLSKLEDFYRDEKGEHFDRITTFPPNPSQVEAIIKGIKSKDIFLVMGPPGTGKTTVILEWIKYFVLEKNMRVLVSSQNNKAVDNVIERIIEEKGIDVLRIGSEAKLQENVKECMYENKISALRRNIVDAADKNTKALDKLAVLWNEILEKMPVLNDALVLIGEKQKALDQAIKSKLAPLHRVIVSTLSSIKLTQTDIKKFQQKMDSKLIYEMRRNSSRNTLSRFWFSFLFWLSKPSIKRLATKIFNLKVKENSDILKYKTTYKKYEAAYINAANCEFADFLAATEKYTLLAGEIFGNTPQSVAGMFSFSENPIEFRTVAELEIFKNKLTTELRRATLTKKVLADWRQDISSEQTYALEKIVLENVNLVGATCIGISSQRKFADLDFDVTIIDEAGQIQIHNALVPMSLSNKLIMLGDHKQIPPSADEEIIQACKDHEVDSTLLKRSLFENLYNQLPDSNKRMLDTQFRMPAEIADIISEWFYSGEYKSPDFKRNLDSEIPEISDKPFIVVDTSDSNNRFETPVVSGGQTIRYNDLECEIIVDIIKLLKERNYNFSEIGVIAGLKAQVSRIKETLIKAGFDKTVVNEMVATLDSFQGQERKIILYSFTRSSKKPPEANRIGFLTELRRINVAMSRCKKTMVMIGDMTFLANCQSTVDFHGDEAEKDQTEKNFSEFISKMLSDVKDKGRGELIKFAEFKKRITENLGKEG